MMRALAFVAILWALAACGFEPLYATGAGTSNLPTALRQIEVAPLADRTGQQLQTALIRRLRPGGGASSGDFLLKISLEDDMQFIGIREDAAPTRQRLQLAAQYELINQASDAVIFSGTALADSSIDIVDSEYATYIAEEAARERNAQIIAERVLSRLVLYFRARAQAEPGR